MDTATDRIQGRFLRPARSQFLSILCVLSFIGSAYGLISAVTLMTNADKFIKVTSSGDPKKVAEHRQQLEKRKDKGSKFEIKMMDSVKDLSDKKKLLQKSIGAILANLLTLAGAILMWLMNPKGYIFYLAGILLWIFAPVVIFGTGSFIAVMETAIAFFGGLLMCILYAMNLKDMKRENVD